MGLDLATARGANWVFRTDDDWVYYPGIIHLRDIANGNCPKPEANAINIHLVGTYGDIYHLDNTGCIADIGKRLKDYQFCLPGMFRVAPGFMFCSVAVFPYTRNCKLNYRTYVDRRISAMHTKFVFPLHLKTEEEKLNHVFNYCYRTAQSLWKDPCVANYNDIKTEEELKVKIMEEAKNFYRVIQECINNDYSLEKADRRLILPYPPKILTMNPIEYVKKGYPFGLPVECIQDCVSNSYW